MSLFKIKSSFPYYYYTVKVKLFIDKTKSHFKLAKESPKSFTIF